MDDFLDDFGISQTRFVAISVIKFTARRTVLYV